MHSHDVFNRLCLRLYDAAVGDGTWPDALQEIGATIGAGSAAALWFTDNGQQLADAQIWGMDPVLMQDYATHYIQTCPRLRMSRSMQPGSVYDDRPARMSNAPATRAYYDFMDRNDSGLARIVVVERNPRSAIGVSFYGPLRDREAEDDIGLLTALAPHIQKAALLGRHVASLTARSDMLEALAHSLDPVMLVDRTGQVLVASAAAEKIMAARDGLCIVAGSLRAVHAADHNRLVAELGSAFGTTGLATAGFGALRVRRADDRSPLVLTIIRLRAPIALKGRPPRDVAMVRIIEARRAASPDLLRRIYGLTPSESEVAAAIAVGFTVEEVSAQRGASIHTTRTQLKTILAKTEARSQVQLSHLVCALLGTARPDGA